MCGIRNDCLLLSGQLLYCRTEIALFKKQSVGVFSTLLPPGIQFLESSKAMFWPFFRSKKQSFCVLFRYSYTSRWVHRKKETDFCSCDCLHVNLRPMGGFKRTIMAFFPPMVAQLTHPSMLSPLFLRSYNQFFPVLTHRELDMNISWNVKKKEESQLSQLGTSQERVGASGTVVGFFFNFFFLHPSSLSFPLSRQMTHCDMNRTERTSSSSKRGGAG